jgi:EmrB/QacA subfamily drug resistance transporter
MDSQKTSRSAILLVVCIVQFIMPFMMSAVGIALPTMGHDLNASALQLGLVESTYILSAASFMLAMGRLGDIQGRERIFKIGLVIFTCAGGAISQASAIEFIIVLRFIQGFGGAMIMSTGMAMVVAAYPPSERGKALGIAVATVYAGISVGPFIGGYMVAVLGWRSLFYLLLPLGLIAWVVAVKKTQPEPGIAQGEPFDWTGAVLYALAVVLLMVGATHLSADAWGWGLLALSLFCFVLFYKLELRSRFPLLDVRLLRDNRVFALSNLAALFNYAATFGVTFFLSLYLQYVKGMEPQMAGSILIVQPIMQTVFSPLCGRLSDKVSASLVATIGMACCAIGLAIAATLGADSSLWGVFCLLIFLGIGFALFSAPNTSMIMGSVEARHLGVASGLSATMRTLGMTVSMMVITLIFSYLMGGHGVTPETQPQFLASMRLALLVFCGFCVVGIGCSLGRFGKKGTAKEKVAAAD